MHFSEIVYKRNFRISVLDPYLYETIISKVAINEGEDAKYAFEMAKQFVLEQGSKAVQYPDHHHIEEHSLPPEPTVLPSIQVDRTELISLEEQIEACTELEELKTFRHVATKTDAAWSIYSIKYDQLQRKQLQP